MTNRIAALIDLDREQQRLYALTDLDFVDTLAALGIVDDGLLLVAMGAEELLSEINCEGR